MSDIALDKFKIDDEEEEADVDFDEINYKTLRKFFHYLNTNALEIFKRKRNFKLEAKMIKRLKTFLLKKNSVVQQTSLFKDNNKVSNDDEFNETRPIRSQSLDEVKSSGIRKKNGFGDVKEKYLEKLKTLKLKDPSRVKDLTEKMKNIRDTTPKRNLFSLKLY